MDRVARQMCYVGELFLTLMNTSQLNNYDYGWGILNPSYMNTLKCKALQVRKALCYKN